MEEYKNIMKLIDNKLEEQESVIEYYRNKQKEWEEHSNKLVEEICILKEKIDGYEAEKSEMLQAIGLEEEENNKLRAENKQLKEKIEELTF